MNPHSLPFLSLMDKTFVKKIKTVCFAGSKMLIVTNSDTVFGLGILPDFSLYRDIFKLRSIHQLDKKLVKKFVFGDNFVMALTEKGEVYSWGQNNQGQLGLGHNQRVREPTIISSLSQNQKEVIDVSCGTAHAIALCKDRWVYAWGKNYQNSPVLIIVDAIGITSSAEGCFFIESNGEVRGKGYLFVRNKDNSYSIGNNYTTAPLNIWEKINSLNGFVKIAAGKHHMIALNSDGIVFVWGSNENGQLTDTLDEYQLNPMKFAKFPGKIIDIAAHPQSDLSAAMTENSEIYVWGVLQNGAFSEPILTSCTSLKEVFVKFSYPSVSLESITLNIGERIKYLNLRTAVLETMFDVQDDSDFTINIEGKNIFVHKLILKMNSKYFHAMFTNAWKESNKKILKIDGYSYKAFRNFLLYLYSGEIDVTSENVFELMKIGDEYSDEDLLALIEEKIEISSISENVVKIAKEIMKLSSEDYETFCNGMKKFMEPTSSQLVD